MIKFWRFGFAEGWKISEIRRTYKHKKRSAGARLYLSTKFYVCSNCTENAGTKKWTHTFFLLERRANPKSCTSSNLLDLAATAGAFFATRQLFVSKTLLPYLLVQDSTQAIAVK